MPPRPVLFVHHTSVLGGAERSLLELLEDLDRSRFPPALVLPGDGPLAEEARRIGIAVIRAPLSRWVRRAGALARAGYALRLPLATARIVEAILSRRARIVHANSGVAALQAAAAARLSGRPLVWHFRDRLPSPRILGILRRAAAAAVALTGEAAEALGRAGIEAVAVPNGIDAEAFPRPPKADARRALGLPAGAPLLLCAAQLVPWKGHGTLLEAFAAVRRRAPDAILLVAGADPHGDHPDLLAGLRARGAAPDLAGTVLFLGPRPDVPVLLAAADLLVHPAAGEPFGRILLEAGAAGRPAVACDGAGPREILAPACPEALVPPGDAERLADAIVARLSDPARAASEADALAGRVRDAFPRRAVAERIQALFESL